MRAPIRRSTLSYLNTSVQFLMSATGDSRSKRDLTKGTLPARARTLGIVPRLAFSFLAVTVLAVAANLIAEHGARVIETTEFAAGHASPLIRLPLPVQPTVRNAPVALGETVALLPAFERADRAVRARLELDDAAGRAELEQAVSELKQQAAKFPRQLGATAGRTVKAAVLTQEFIRQGAEAVQLADDRRALDEDYRRRLAGLDATLAQAIDKGWKVFGRVFAKQSLLNLSRDLQRIETSSVALSAASYHDEAAIDALRANELAFAVELRKSRDNLRRSQGEPWLSKFDADFDGLGAVRIAGISADQDLRSSVERLNLKRDRFAGLVKATLAKAAAEPPAALALQGASGLPLPVIAPLELPEQRAAKRIVTRVASPEEKSSRAWVFWITIAVLASLLATSISTIVSVVRPVRRLIQATRRLSEGGVVQVERGGIREIDDLAVAFNDMAAQLVSARAAVTAHQETLEQRVQERTHALQHLAEHDALTQLPNRRLLLQRLNEALTDARLSGRRVGVFFIDLDNFKNINDGLGHEFGDLVLLSVAQRLSETAAAFGFAARLGGDEFTVLYPAAASAAAVAETGRSILRAFQRPIAVGDRALSISASIGASVFPEHAAQAEPLLRAADAALFRAKALGRSQLHLFSPDLVEAAHAKFMVEQGLRRALEHGEFELVYQPEMEVTKLATNVVEALLRWRTPDGRLLSPDAFLSVAEESGLIMELTDWVIRTAIAAAASWHHGSWPDVRVALNVSPRQLFDTRFVDRIQELLTRHSLPPHCIEIELTENLLQTGSNTIEALRRLRACGIAIALDDFGTGYSSFASLEVLPLTRVKLDRSLIASIDTSSQSWAIASSIIGLCRSLGFQITAEGVERPGQLAMLVAHGATHIQGYLLSRPVAADDLPAELAALPGRLESLLLTMPVPAAAAAPRKLAAVPGSHSRHNPR